MEISFGSMFQLLAPAEPHIKQQQRRSHAYRAIGNVERREGMLDRVDFDEVRNRAMYNTIVQIAERASEHERQAYTQYPTLRPASFPQQRRDEDQHGDGKPNEEHVAPRAG